MSWIYPIVSVLIVSLIAFIGLWSISIKTLKKTIIYLVSFSAGGMLGNVFFHLLPESFEHGFTIKTSLFILAGIVSSFIIEKIIWHHCHLHKCTASHRHRKVQPFAILNLIGDGVHNFIDGLIIGASYLVSIPVGVSTTIAVILHEIPQEIGDFGVLIYGGFKRAQALFYNFLSALTALIGVIIALIISTTTEITHVLIPFAAGNFIYIACTDLLPELHKNVKVKESLLQALYFLLGIGVMLVVLVFFNIR